MTNEEIFEAIGEECAGSALRARISVLDREILETLASLEAEASAARETTRRCREEISTMLAEMVGRPADTSLTRFLAALAPQHESNQCPSDPGKLH